DSGDEHRVAPAQQGTKIDAFRVVIELTPVDCESRPPRERLRQAGSVKEVAHIVVHTRFDRLAAALVSDVTVDLGECLQYEAGVEVVDEIADTIGRVEPASVRLLSVQHKV